MTLTDYYRAKAIAAGSGLIAEEYDSTKTYGIGDFCIYMGKLYVCTAETTGTWDANDWDQVSIMSTLVQELDETRDMIAATFESTESYEAGEYTVYGDYLYRFTSAHSGTWDGGDVEMVTVGEVLDSLSGDLTDHVGNTTIHVTSTDKILWNNAVASLAPAFSDSTAYSEDDYVTYNGLLYKFEESHAAGDWTGSDATAVTVAEEIAAAVLALATHTSDSTIHVTSSDKSLWNNASANFAGTFSTSTAYDAGEYVIYEGLLYQFTSGHTAGDWDETEVTSVTVGEKLVDIGNDIADLNDDLTLEQKYQLLLNDEVPDTTETYTFDSDGSVSQVTHTSNGTTVRTDAFTYTTTTITEVRTLNTGESLTIATNLSTLETTVTYTAA